MTLAAFERHLACFLLSIVGFFLVRGSVASWKRDACTISDVIQVHVIGRKDPRTGEAEVFPVVCPRNASVAAVLSQLHLDDDVDIQEMNLSRRVGYGSFPYLILPRKGRKTICLILPPDTIYRYDLGPLSTFRSFRKEVEEDLGLPVSKKLSSRRKRLFHTEIIDLR